VAELWFTSIDGTLRLPGYAIGPYGAWGDLQWSFRWGEGACGLFEVQFSMPLPADFDHALVRRGTLIEVTDGPYRMGSPAILSEPAKGAGIEDPWQFTATGIGREVEGSDSFYAADGSGNATTIPSTAVAQAITDGWRIAGAAASVPSSAPSTPTVSEGLNTVAALLGASATVNGQRWGVGQDNVLAFTADPTTPTYQITPAAVALGTSDDNYASTVKVRYLDSTTGTYLTRTATNANVAARFGVKQYMVDVTDQGAMSSTTAQSIADQTLALAKGRLSWTNNLTVTSNELLTMGGVPASLSKVAEDVGTGCMIRLNGINNDLLEVQRADVARHHHR
jgi:hypothetical protein